MSKSKDFLQKLKKPFLSSSNKATKEEDLDKIAAQEQKLFSFQTLVAATKNFHESNKLGEGDFGTVYKGKLDDGREIAVKKLSYSSNQGKKEFQNEAKLLARVYHRNVVNLLGYCAHGQEKLIVYEYIVNGSLDKYIFKADERNLLDWNKRHEIIMGMAKGLLYLHEAAHSCIIHHDIKANNILLDDKWMPKIADFGMARIFLEDQTQVKTRAARTNGYMAPEYVMHGRLTTESDVFSFGVVVLELISGQKNLTFNQDVECRDLLEWVYKLYKKRKSLDIMDPSLAPSAVPDQVLMCVKIGLLCTQSNPQLRPSMRRVVVMLSKNSGTLEEPTRPGYPGSSYRRSCKTNPPYSTSGNFAKSDLHSFGSTTNTASATVTTSARGSVGQDPCGKRPMEYCES